MAKRLAVVRFWFQGNAFSPLSTSFDSFRQCVWSEGKEVLEAARGTDSELAAVAEFASSRPDWEVTVLRCAAANPSGPIEESVFAGIMEEIVVGLAAGPGYWDAVYLALHGAAITTERDAPDLDLVRAVRAAVGDVPVAASFDAQANVDPELATLLDFASVSRALPAGDRFRTALRVLDRLAAVAGGASRPRGAIVRTSVLLCGPNMSTGSGPMSEIVATAQAATVSPVLDISVFSGFPYADVRTCSASAMAYAEDDAAAARAAALGVAQAIVARRSEFRVALPGPNQALGEALKARPGLVAVTEVSDDPLAGGCGDTPGLFRALLDLQPAFNSVFAFFTDSQVVERCLQAGVGTTVDLELGAKTSRDFGARVPVKAHVLRATDGRFRNRGRVQFGMPVDLGHTVVLDITGIQVIITGRCQPANDPAFFDLHGIDLAATRLLCVKASHQFRTAFDTLCARIIDCNALGPANADLASLPFRNLRPR